MSLSPEDNLRLNVLLRQKPLAIRINDSRLIVSALTPKGEAKVELSPTCRDEKYLRLVRELLSTHVLGSPGGYPVYLKRWTRLGQSRDNSSLERLLLLGEPEAIVAVVNSPDINHDLARRAWWAYPDAEVARQLLQSKPVIEGELGQEIANFLIEFLPFETEHQAIIDSVKLILQPGLIDTDTQLELWKRARRKQTYFIGFLHSKPNELPDKTTPHPQFSSLSSALQSAPKQDAATLLAIHVLDSSGQLFIKTVAQVLQKLPNQDAAVELLEAVGQYFSGLRPDDQQYREIADIEQRAEAHLQSEAMQTARNALQAQDGGTALLKAMIMLSMMSEYVVAPIFGHTDAIGSVMRKKLQPVSTAIQHYLTVLNPNLATGNATHSR